MITTWTRLDHLVMVPKMIRKNLNVPKNRFSLQASSRVTHLWMRILARRENFGPSIRFSAGWQWTWKYFLFSAWPRLGPENILRRLYDYLKYALPDLEKQIQLFHFHHTNRYFLVSFKLFDQKSEASTINRPILAHKFWDSMIFWRMKIKQTPISDFFLFNSGIKRSFMEYFWHMKYCYSQK